MASKRRLRKKQCGNKRRFETTEDVAKVVKHMRRTGNLEGKTRIYKCRWCGKYHWGHSGSRS